MTDKSLVRRGPVAVDPFARNMDRMFNTMLESMLGPLGAQESWLGSNLRTGAWVPATDIRETDDAFHVSVELPGLSKKDVNVSVENNQLTISGERRWEEKEDRESLHRVERGYGQFSRSFLLSGHVDPDKVKAVFKDGVLEIDVPKSEEARPRRITIG